MANKGTITAQELATDGAVNRGLDIAKSLDVANHSFELLIKHAIEFNAISKGFTNVRNEKEFIELKQKEINLTKSIIQIEKEKANVLIQSQKAENEKLRGDKIALDIEAKKQTAIKKTTQSTAEQTRMSRLQIVANTSLEGSYRKIQAQLSINTEKWKALSEAERTNTAQGRTLTRDILNQESALKKLDTQIGKNQRNVGNYGSAFGSIKTSVSGLFGAFGIVGGLSAFATITQDIYKQTKELQALDLALQTVTTTQKNFQEQQQFLRKIAFDYGADLNTLTKSFISFYASAKDKLAGNEIQDIFESVTKAGGVLGLSVERQEKAFLALNQMMSKGTVQAEELRGQLSEALPNSMGIMTKAVQALHPELDITEKKLGEMMKNGELLSSEVLPEFARQMEKAYGIENVKKVDILTARTNRMSNEWTDFIRVLNESPTGGFFGDFFGTMMDMGTDFLKLLKDIVSTQAQIDKGVVLSAQQRGRDAFKEKSDQQKSYQFVKKNGKLETVQGEASSKDKIDYAINNSKGAAAEIRKLNVELKKAEAQAEKTIVKFGDGYEALLDRVTDIKEKIGFQSGVNTAAKDRIKELKTPKKKAQVENPDSETNAQMKKRLSAERKTNKELLDEKKNLSNALYDLEKQSLEQGIKLDEERASDEKETDEARVQALYDSQQKQEDLLLLSKNHLLENDKLTANDRIRIEKDYEFKVIEINKKTQEEVDKINEFDLAKYQSDLDRKVKSEETAMNNKIADEEQRFNEEIKSLGDNQKAIEEATQKHEKKLFDIKKDSLIAIAKIQYQNLETELNNFKAQSDGSEKSAQIIEDIELKLSIAKKDIWEAENQTFKNNQGKKTGWAELSAKEQAEKILEISSRMTGALADLANAFSEAKIQKIDDEIEKNNEFYDREIELAGDDQKKKELLQKEKEKKNDILEKKKRKEQEKQAKYDKAVTVAQIGITTALAIMKAAPEPWEIALVSVLGAIQLATAIATPIPKYKHGRKGGKAEFAEVGDGFVSEVVQKKDGRTYITPSKPTLTYLEEDDTVYSSIEAFQKQQRAGIMASLNMEGKKVSDYQASMQFQKSYDKELFEEMKLTRKAIQNQKAPVVINKIDISHKIWASKTTKWS